VDSQRKSVEEQQFLEAIALKLKLIGDPRAAFLARFNPKNANTINSNLVSFITWNNEPEDKSQKLQEELQNICKILEDNGCPFNKPKRGRSPKGQSPWEQGYKWLWESRFPEWQRENNQRLSMPGEICSNGQAIIDALVQQVRSRLLPVITAPGSAIGTMRMFSVSQPMPVDKIYIDLNVLEQLSCSYNFSDWRQKFDPDNCHDFDRLGLGRVRERRVEALSAVKDYPKLMVLGKPGAGKTTLLKSLAVECVQPETELFANLVPLFVTLRDFAKKASETQSWKLLDYLTWLLAEQSNGFDRASAEQILMQGRSLVLLDGLDEVPPNDLERVLYAVREFGYRVNRLVITCRTQSQRQLEGFTDVEVADFTPQQVDRFVDNWFTIVDSGSQVSLAPQLQQQLRQKENQAIAELAVTPVLLNLICVVFKGQGNLPEKRFDLYDDAMRLLLERLKRSPIDQTLTFAAKEKFLAEIAFMLFQNNDYFPEQRTLEKFIESYFKVDRFAARKTLEIFETETGLLIERSAGYWSFSHLTFHEYFVAKKIIDFNGKVTDLEIKQLLKRHILDNNWHEVFRLIAERNGNE
jgi:predicted NACHT family NTPase